MKPGDLRWFNASLDNVFDGAELFAGCAFTVLEVDYNHALARGGSVKFLIDGRVEEGWSRLWVLENSEVLNEAR